MVIDTRAEKAAATGTGCSSVTTAVPPCAPVR